MERPVYRARRELFERMDIPVTKADIQILKWKQRSRLVVWEGMLRSLLVFKRLLDILLSSVALVLLLPILIVVAVCIIIEDGFPVIYMQKRVGLNGREFRFYKFRSMVKGADKLKLDFIPAYRSTNLTPDSGVQHDCPPITQFQHGSIRGFYRALLHNFKIIMITWQPGKGNVH